MPASRPDRGEVTATVAVPEDALADLRRRGRGEPQRGRGLAVIFRRRPGETPRRLLQKPFYFQCPPTETFRWRAAHAHTDYDTVGAGQHDRPAGKQLIAVDFSTLFVDYDPPWAAYRYGTADNHGADRRLDGEYVPPAGDRGQRRMVGSGPRVNPLGWSEQLLELVESGAPFNLTVGQPNWWDKWDIRNLAVTLRDLQVEERAGERDARYIEVQLIEHREMALKRQRRGAPVTVTVDQETGRATWDDGDYEQHSVKSPTLRELAKQIYGDPSEWRRIAKSAGLKGVTGGDSLEKYAGKHGHGKKGERRIKIVVPEREPKPTPAAPVGRLPSVIDPTVP
jgi:hypothetical protein